MRILFSMIIISTALLTTVRLLAQEEGTQRLASVRAEANERENEYEKFYNSNNSENIRDFLKRVSLEKSLDEHPLPNHVVAPEGKLTLYADYTDAFAGEITLYVINRTNEEIELSMQDGELYFKLEYKNEKGEWVRAQPHQYTGCGNSHMFPPTLKAGEYRKDAGYFPTTGELKDIRYKRYAGNHQIVSNVGLGYILKKDVEAAKSDDMALGFGNLDFISSIALGTHELKAPNSLIISPRDEAIRSLTQERFKKEQVLSILEKIIKEESNERIVESAQESISIINNRSKKPITPDISSNRHLYYAAFIVFLAGIASYFWKRNLTNQ